MACARQRQLHSALHAKLALQNINSQLARLSQFGISRVLTIRLAFLRFQMKWRPRTVSDSIKSAHETSLLIQLPWFRLVFPFISHMCVCVFAIHTAPTSYILHAAAKTNFRPQITSPTTWKFMVETANNFRCSLHRKSTTYDGWQSWPYSILWSYEKCGISHSVPIYIIVAPCPIQRGKHFKLHFQNAISVGIDKPTTEEKKMWKTAANLRSHEIEMNNNNNNLH